MKARVLQKEDLPQFVANLLRGRKVVGPKANGIQFSYGPIADFSELRLDYPITILSLKKLFFPAEEALVTYDLDGKTMSNVEPAVEGEPLVVLGAHRCDIAGVDLLDTVFGAKNPDVNYLKRREQSVIIGLDCMKPCDEYSYCSDMGSVWADDGCDLMMTDLGDAYIVDVKTDKGEDLLLETGLTRGADIEDLNLHRMKITQKKENFTKKLPVDAKYLPQVLDESYDSLIWGAVSQKCFSCGMCNLVCPTCYCFDVQEKMNLDLTKGTRQRRWDSCQLDGFARVAGGENFREERSSRLRHRMFRKAKYIKQQTGKMGCTGCGRCDRTCVAKISQLKTFIQLTG